MRTVIVLLVLAAGGAGGYYYWRQRQAALQQAAVPQVVTAKVERGPLKVSVAANGRVVSNLDVDIKCKASGEIVKLPFDISDTVKKGELMLEVDPVDQKRAVDLADVALASSSAHLASAKQNLVIAEQKLVTDKMRADPNLKSAQAKAERARIKADRLKGALASNAATQEDYDTAETEATQALAERDIAKAQIEELKTEEAGLEVKRQDIKLAEAEVKSDQIALDNAKQRLIETKVMAPMDGVVVSRLVQAGQIIASAVTNVGGGSTVLTLSDLSHIYTLGSMDESLIGDVKLDQPVMVKVDAFPGRRFRGKVVRIATRGVNVSNVVSFEVKIEIVDEKKTMLKPEMTTDIEIIVAQKKEALLVPVEALSRKQDKSYVTVQKDDGTKEERPVEIGASDRVKTEILDGAQEGETLVLKKSGADSRFQGQGRAPNPMQMMGAGGRR
ncbi:MAG: efflux RND transporter periplasmic adaptor subunit [Planctomycetota bacterium]|nr:efflux RND transporter periplasmic adaptor subunit [Planctomycetota bacterium]